MAGLPSLPLDNFGSGLIYAWDRDWHVGIDSQTSLLRLCSCAGRQAVRKLRYLLVALRSAILLLGVSSTGASAQLRVQTTATTLNRPHLSLIYLASGDFPHAIDLLKYLAHFDDRSCLRVRGRMGRLVPWLRSQYRY